MTVTALLVRGRHVGIVMQGSLVVWAGGAWPTPEQAIKHAAHYAARMALPAALGLPAEETSAENTRVFPQTRDP